MRKGQSMHCDCSGLLGELEINEPLHSSYWSIDYLAVRYFFAPLFKAFSSRTLQAWYYTIVGCTYFEIYFSNRCLLFVFNSMPRLLKWKHERLLFHEASTIRLVEDYCRCIWSSFSLTTSPTCKSFPDIMRTCESCQPNNGQTPLVPLISGGETTTGSDRWKSHLENPCLISDCKTDSIDIRLIANSMNEIGQEKSSSYHQISSEAARSCVLCQQCGWRFTNLLQS